MVGSGVGGPCCLLWFFQRVVQVPRETGEVLSKVFRQKMLPGWSFHCRDDSG